jgi:hypothetical protein
MCGSMSELVPLTDKSDWGGVSNPTWTSLAVAGRTVTEVRNAARCRTQAPFFIYEVMSRWLIYIQSEKTAKDILD